VRQSSWLETERVGWELIRVGIKWDGRGGSGMKWDESVMGKMRW
jgi:hypothetical protein